MGLKVVAYVNEDFEETLGVNDRVQLAYAEKYFVNESMNNICVTVFQLLIQKRLILALML